MHTSDELRQRLGEIIEDARFAPSVHNTQPWRIRADTDAIRIDLDPTHLLDDGDPTGRQTIISLGILSEAIILSAQEKGFHAAGVKLADKQAVVSFSTESNVTQQESFVPLLRSRVTDRSIYKKAEITDDMTAAITQANQMERVRIWVRTDADFIGKAALLISKGISLALTNPRFRLELSRYLVRPLSGKTRGISVRSLYIPFPLAVFEPVLMRLGIGLKAEVALEKRRWESASGVVCITSEGDMAEDWFEVGRAYLQVALAIEGLGLSQATSAACVEASTFHEDIESLLGTNQRLQSMIRIGHGKSNRVHSPRVPTEKLIATSN